jgi:cell division protease FtsH
MISDYGMSERFRNVTLSSQRSPLFLPGEAAPGQREYSESTQQYVDEEITRIVNARYEKAVKFLEEKRATVEKIAQRLLEVETIGEEEFRALAGVGASPGG